MSTEVIESNTAVTIWNELIQPASGGMAPDVARFFLELQFPKTRLDRIHDLLVRNQAGALTPEELAEMNTYLQIGTQLDILKAKARLSLKRVDEPGARKLGLATR